MDATVRSNPTALRRPPRRQVSVRLLPEVVAALDATALKTNRLRSELIEDLLVAGLGPIKPSKPVKTQIFD